MKKRLAVHKNNSSQIDLGSPPEPPPSPRRSLTSTAGANFILAPETENVNELSPISPADAALFATAPTDGWISLADVHKYIPGRPSKNLIYKWADKGRRGNVLRHTTRSMETIRAGKRSSRMMRVTNLRWIIEFQNAPDNRPPTPPTAPKLPHRRPKNIARARAAAIKASQDFLDQNGCGRND